MLRFVFVAVLAALSSEAARGWGNEGHSIVAEIAQRRLDPRSSAAVAKVLGPGASLASIASWADDIRDSRRSTAPWHYVNVPVASSRYDAGVHCRPDGVDGACVVEVLNRLRTELRCAADASERNEALRYAVHFVGDIHQPFHALADARGGNDIPVTATIAGPTCTGNCRPTTLATNLHAVWDSTLVQKAARSWGAMVERIEAELPRSMAGATASANPAAWANETHAVGQRVWTLTPANRVIDEVYFNATLPVVVQQLGRAGARLAQFLNAAYAAEACPAR